MGNDATKLPLGEGARVPAMPLDGRHLLDDSRDREKTFVRKRDLLIAVEHLHAAYWLSGPVGIVLLALVLWMLSADLLPAALPAWLYASSGLALLTAAGWLLVRHVVISRVDLLRWRVVITAVLLLQALVWTFPLLDAVTLPEPAERGLSLLVAALAINLTAMPLLYWPPGFVLVVGSYLVAGGLMMAVQGQDLQAAYYLLIAVLPMFFAVILVKLLLARFEGVQNREKRQAYDISQLQENVSDHAARISYERDQRQDVEKELDVVREVAEGASRAKTEFLAAISHEIRTPLNGILPILELLNATRLDKEQAKLVSTAFSSSHHLLRIIDDILDFAKAESGKLQLESIEVDLRSLVQSVTELMHRSAEKRGLVLATRIADEVPRLVRGDPIRLRQILTNLVSNSIKFTERGGIRIEISRRRSSRKEVELLFAVVDTGVGMTRETSRQLFQSFTQADASTTRKHGGTGMGLAICRRLVDLMGGDIGVRSRVGDGSNFWFVLPLRKSAQDVPTARRNLEGVRLLTLITDEETAMRVSEMLAEWGVQVERAQNAADAVNKLKSSALLGKTWAYELFLLDSLGMEQQTVHTLRELRSTDTLGDLRILITTRSATQAEQLKQRFGVYLLEDALRPEPLRRALFRLFDVAGESRYFVENDQQAPDTYRDLNVEMQVPYEGEDTQSRSDGVEGTVLLVEDNPVNLGVVKKIVTRTGMHCVVALDGVDALEQFQSTDIDLVFMDCQMPRMDGYQATGKIRELEKAGNKPAVPVIAMTANAMAGDRDKCLHAGMDDYLAKPVSVSQIENMLKKWLGDGKGATLPQKEPEDTAVQDSQLLNQSVLDELQEIMEEDFTALIITYLDNAPKLIMQLQTAVQAADVAGMVTPAHSLKSSSANVGASTVSAAARGIELAAKAGQFDKACTEYGLLTAQYQLAAPLLRRITEQGTLQ